MTLATLPGTGLLTAFKKRDGSLGADGRFTFDDSVTAAELEAVHPPSEPVEFVGRLEHPEKGPLEVRATVVVTRLHGREARVLVTREWGDCEQELKR